jgi:hypothetical protein
MVLGNISGIVLLRQIEINMKQYETCTEAIWTLRLSVSR